MESQTATRPRQSSGNGPRMGGRQNDCPSRSSRRPPRRSRTRSDPPGSPGESSDLDRQERSSRPSGPQHHELSPDVADDSCFFDFFYQVIFSLVHLALSVVLTPVLGKSLARRREPWKPPPKANVDDPELAIPESDSESVGSYQPILKTMSRRCGDNLSEKKSVRFPPPERRIPLGRIGLPSSSSSSSSSSRSVSSRSSCFSPSVSSSDSESSSSRGERREGAVRNSKPLGSRRRLSPLPLGRFPSPRMNHSTYYFLE